MVKPDLLPSPLCLVTSTNVPSPGIPEQPVLPHAGDEQIEKSVVVVIADRNPKPVHLDVRGRPAA